MQQNQQMTIDMARPDGPARSGTTFIIDPTVPAGHVLHVPFFFIIIINIIFIFCGMKPTDPERTVPVMSQ